MNALMHPRSRVHDPIATAATLVLETYGSEIPVNPEAIALSAGIEVRDASEDSTFDPLNPYSGRYLKDSGRALIYINRTDVPVRQRFTMAHELGHHFLKHGDSFRDTSASFSTGAKKPHEIAANRFAAELLMPEEVVRSAVGRIENLSELAKGFGVSTVAMNFRLQNLDLLRHYV